MLRKPWKQQQGAELVEFAITVPVILAIALILVEFAVALCDQAVLTNAARAAAREVIRGGSDVEGKIAAERVFPSMIAWPTKISRDDVEVAPNDAARSGGNVEGREITVTIRYPYNFLLLPSFLSGVTSFELTARTKMYELKQ